MRVPDAGPGPAVLPCLAAPLRLPVGGAAPTDQSPRQGLAGLLDALGSLHSGCAALRVGTRMPGSALVLGDLGFRPGLPGALREMGARIQSWASLSKGGAAGKGDDPKENSKAWPRPDALHLLLL